MATSFRLVLALHAADPAKPDILVHRRFPSVETRARTRPKYALIPEGPAFVGALLRAGDRARPAPAGGVRVLDVDGVRPVVTQRRGDLLLAVVPYDDSDLDLAPTLSQTQSQTQTQSPSHTPTQTHPWTHARKHGNAETDEEAAWLHPCIAASISLLEILARLVVPLAPGAVWDTSHLADVQALISALMPFGRPIEATLANVRGARHWQFSPKEPLPSVAPGAVLYAPGPPSPSSSSSSFFVAAAAGAAALPQSSSPPPVAVSASSAAVATGSKRPTWKPQLFRGSRQQVDFVIREEVSCAQYDNAETPDVSAVSGNILCKADVEGLPEVTASLMLRPRPNSSLELASASLHHCCQQTDVLTSRRLCFVPPVGFFTLCSYYCQPQAGCSYLPFRGYYQMKELSRTDVKLLVQIKLSESYLNKFEYCRVVIPFPNRGQIVSCDLAPTVGSVAVDERRGALVWNLGTKIVGRNLEVSMPGTVRFEPFAPPIEAAAAVSDADHEAESFCVGPNAYVLLSFKLLGDSATGLEIDGRNVALYPTARAAVHISREVVSRDYRIWNSFGEALSTPLYEEAAAAAEHAAVHVGA